MRSRKTHQMLCAQAVHVLRDASIGFGGEQCENVGTAVVLLLTAAVASLQITALQEQNQQQTEDIWRCSFVCCDVLSNDNELSWNYGWNKSQIPRNKRKSSLECSCSQGFAADKRCQLNKLGTHTWTWWLLSCLRQEVSCQITPAHMICP